ncbi:MAG: hypothetical protein WBV23_02795 [Desulfobaccales bacterium]
MGTMIFGAGTLFGVFLGVVFISLLGMAQKADKVYDWLDPGEAKATPEDTYYFLPSATSLPTGRGEGWPPKDPDGLQPGKGRINHAGMPRLRVLRGADL